MNIPEAVANVLTTVGSLINPVKFVKREGIGAIVPQVDAVGGTVVAIILSFDLIATW